MSQSEIQNSPRAMIPAGDYEHGELQLSVGDGEQAIHFHKAAPSAHRQLFLFEFRDTDRSFA